MKNFTAEDLLLSKWCNTTVLQIWRRNKLIYILHCLRESIFSAHFYFGVNYSFNKYNYKYIYKLII